MLSADSVGGSTFRKRAGAAGAVEARVAAAEARAARERRERAAAARVQAGWSGVKAEPNAAGVGSLGEIDLVSDDEDDDEDVDGSEDDSEDFATPAPRFSGRGFPGPGAAPERKPVVQSEDEADVKPFTEEERRYLSDEFDGWEDDFLIVQGGAGSATVPPGRGGAGAGGKGSGSDDEGGKKDKLEVLTLDDSEDDEKHAHGAGGLCCGYDMAAAWAEFERDVEAGLWEAC